MREGGRGGGIKGAERRSPAAVKDVPPLRQDLGPRSAPRPGGRRDERTGATPHLSTGDPPGADPRPVEPHQPADQRAAGTINTSDW